MVSKGFPNVITSGRQYNIGEKPSVILYTYINLHAGTPKPHPFNLRVLDYSVVIWSYMILEKFGEATKLKTPHIAVPFTHTSIPSHVKWKRCDIFYRCKTIIATRGGPSRSVDMFLLLWPCSRCQVWCCERKPRVSVFSLSAS